MTSGSGFGPAPWEIWQLKFAFFERKGYKYHPAVVMDVDEFSVILAVMVTGAESRLSLPNDYLLRDWKEAGLLKPSLVRLDKRLKVDFASIGNRGKIGRLSPYDISQIDAMARSMNAFKW